MRRRLPLLEHLLVTLTAALGGVHERLLRTHGRIDGDFRRFRLRQGGILLLRRFAALAARRDTDQQRYL
jgi:hypothetical protein